MTRPATFKLLLFVVFLLLFVVIPAQADYIISKDGIQLSRPVQANDHINLKVEWKEGLNIVEKTSNLHVDPNNGHPGGNAIGLDFIKFQDWNQYVVDNHKLPAGVEMCVTWVQVSWENYHYEPSAKEQFCFTIEELPDTGVFSKDFTGITATLALLGVLIIAFDAVDKRRKELQHG